MLQKNLPEEVKLRRKPEYKEWKKTVKKLKEDSKRRVDEEFGRSLVKISGKTRNFSGKR